MDITKPETRYECILEVCKLHEPSSIIEIGVHKGARARRFINECLLTNGVYTGYDAFDLLKDHESVFNGKGPGNESIAHMRIQSDRHETRLIKGFTEDTLDRDTVADFVFIDGDHRTSAIWRDFSRVKGSELIVFDDVVINGPEGAGAAPILDHIDTMDEFEYQVIPFRIPFKPSGTCAIAFVWRPGSIESETRDMIHWWAEEVTRLSAGLENHE